MLIERFEKQELNSEQKLFIIPDGASLSDLTFPKKIILDYIASDLEGKHSYSRELKEKRIESCTIVGCKTLNESELVCLVVVRYANKLTEIIEILINEEGLKQSTLFPKTVNQRRLIVDKIFNYESFDELIAVSDLLLKNDYETNVVPIVPKKYPNAASIRYFREG